jgi:hypothetical protein
VRWRNPVLDTGYSPLKSIKLLIAVHHHFDLWNVPSWFPERLRTDFPQIEVTHRTNYDGVGEYLRNSEIVFAFSLRPASQPSYCGRCTRCLRAGTLPAESALWGLENLLITSHTAGLTKKLWQRHYALFSENLRLYLAGEPLLFVVDKRKGY